MVAFISVLPEPDTVMKGTGKMNMILLWNHLSHVRGLK